MVIDQTVYVCDICKDKGTGLNIARLELDRVKLADICLRCSVLLADVIDGKRCFPPHK